MNVHTQIWMRAIDIYCIVLPICLYKSQNMNRNRLISRYRYAYDYVFLWLCFQVSEMICLWWTYDKYYLWFHMFWKKGVSRKWGGSRKGMGDVFGTYKIINMFWGTCEIINNICHSFIIKESFNSHFIYTWMYIHKYECAL